MASPPPWRRSTSRPTASSTSASWSARTSPTSTSAAAWPSSRRAGRGEQRSILVNSGAEAIENAVKIARAATGRPAVIVFENAFHGRTLLTMTMTSKLVYKKSFGPFAPEVYRAPGPYPYRGVSSDAALEALEDLFRSDVDPESVACAVLEPVQGEGGFIPMPRDFPGRLQALLARHGILYVDDEVQSGVGRTGPVWAIEHYGVEPDLVVSGKSLGGGLPLAGVTGRADVMDAPHPGGLGGTFGGSPLSCAAAVAVLDEVASPGFRQTGGRARHAAAAPARGDLGTRSDGRRGARARPDARARARHGPRDEGARGRRREADDGARARARPRPPHLRPLRQRRSHPRARSSRPTRTWRKGSRSWRRRLSTQATERPSAGRSGGRRACARRPARRRPQDVRRRRRRRLDRPRDPARRVLHHARAVGLGQDDDAASDRGLRAPRRGADLPRRRGRGAEAPVRARRQHRLPGLRALPAHDRGGERRVRPQGEARGEG